MTNKAKVKGGYSTNEKRNALNIADYLLRTKERYSKPHLMKICKISSEYSWQQAKNAAIEFGLVVGVREKDTLSYFHADYESEISLVIEAEKAARKQATLHRARLRKANSEKQQAQKRNVSAEQAMQKVAGAEVRLVREQKLPTGRINWYRHEVSQGAAQ